MEETAVYCGYSLRLKTRNSDFPGLPTAVFNFSVEWHRIQVFIDQLGAPVIFEDTKLSELSQSLEMPLCILPWQSLCETHMERVLADLQVHHSFWADIIRAILRTVHAASPNGHGGFDMNVNLQLATKDEVGIDDVEDATIAGYEVNPVTRGVSRNTIEKLERESCLVREGDGCCSICLEELNGAEKVIDTPCSHLFHNRCIVKWLERNDSCPLCRSKVEVEDSE
ncbi:hypothetical protein BT93_C1337 [Corymbia citriodora subsp. variegata]|nr:hypothetical protein BT93_C1337 [Corymbia citriodora subsp. variegata]